MTQWVRELLVFGLVCGSLAWTGSCRSVQAQERQGPSRIAVFQAEVAELRLQLQQKLQAAARTADKEAAAAALQQYDQRLMGLICREEPQMCSGTPEGKYP